VIGGGRRPKPALLIDDIVDFPGGTLVERRRPTRCSIRVAKDVYALHHPTAVGLSGSCRGRAPRSTASKLKGIGDHRPRFQPTDCPIPLPRPNVRGLFDRDR